MCKFPINNTEKQMWVDITSMLVQQMEEDLADQTREFEYGESDEVELNARMSAEADMWNYTPSLEELQEAADARGEPGPLDKTTWVEEKQVTVEAVKEVGNHDSILYDEVLTTVIRPGIGNRLVDAGDAVEMVHRFVDEFDWVEANSVLGVVQKKFDELNAEADFHDEIVEEAHGCMKSEPDDDVDYFEIVKGVKDAAVDYNNEVAKATRNGIEITTTVHALGLISVAKAHVELVV